MVPYTICYRIPVKPETGFTGSGNCMSIVWERSAGVYRGQSEQARARYRVRDQFRLGRSSPNPFRRAGPRVWRSRIRSRMLCTTRARVSTALQVLRIPLPVQYWRSGRSSAQRTQDTVERYSTRAHRLKRLYRKRSFISQVSSELLIGVVKWVPPSLSHRGKCLRNFRKLFRAKFLSTPNTSTQRLREH